MDCDLWIVTCGEVEGSADTQHDITSTRVQTPKFLDMFAGVPDGKRQLRPASQLEL